MGGARRGGRRPARFALYASGDGERHATWLELFFDLVFVLAIAELADYLHDHLTAAGVLGLVLLSLPVWLVWSNFSYYADLFDVDGPLYRVAMLAAMLGSIALAVTIPQRSTAALPASPPPTWRCGCCSSACGPGRGAEWRRPGRWPPGTSPASSRVP